MMGREAWRNLSRRYTQVLRAAWEMRRELDTVPRLRHENDFLPAALALRDTPVHPAPRVAMGMIIALLTVALVWACLGKVNVVATAAGKIIPNGDVKTIQTEDTAVVAAIDVSDGQHVKRGEVLVALNATDAQANVASDEANLRTFRGEVARAQAMLTATSTHQPPALDAASLVGPSLALEQRVLAGEYADYTSNIGKLDANIAEAHAALHETAAEIRKLEQTLPLEQSKERSYAELVTKRYVSRDQYDTEEESVIQMQQDLAAQRAKSSEAKGALSAAERERAVYDTNARKGWLETIHQDDQKIDDLMEDLRKAEHQRSLTRVVAPVSGTVQHLAVHTVGGVVTPAQTLMSIVPDGRQLLVKAIVNNQDIGFVRVGQPAQVKVEAFPFERYGVLHGTVLQVANDAVQDDKLGLVFTAHVGLHTERMYIDNCWIQLVPGMAVTVEIKTGRRRLISYVLSPLIQGARGSFHGR